MPDFRQAILVEHYQLWVLRDSWEMEGFFDSDIAKLQHDFNNLRDKHNIREIKVVVVQCLKL